jgi:hypothetical protein
MDLDAISGPKKSDRPLIPIVNEETGEIVESRALILKDETNPFEAMYKWDVQDRVTISPEARRKYRELILQV